jgi:hypothetical protein
MTSNELAKDGKDSQQEPNEPGGLLDEHEKNQAEQHSSIRALVIHDAGFPLIGPTRFPAMGTT